MWNEKCRSWSGGGKVKSVFTLKPNDIKFNVSTVLSQQKKKLEIAAENKKFAMSSHLIDQESEKEEMSERDEKKEKFSSRGP